MRAVVLFRVKLQNWKVAIVGGPMYSRGNFMLNYGNHYKFPMMLPFFQLTFNDLDLRSKVMGHLHLKISTLTGFSKSLMAIEHICN